jgi:hypothetical protein
MKTLPMKKTLLICFSIISCFSFSQNENNIWYFGDHAAINFNSGAPVAIANSAMFAYDNVSSVADPNTGSLLFYSNGEQVWNANHTIMPNGNGLLGNSSGGNAAFALRQPGSSTIYYLFTSDPFAGSNGLRYSILDMSLQGGLGDITAAKNVLLLQPATEKITAILHSNGSDIWIITHPFNSGDYYAYLLSNTGLNTTPVISTIGSIHSGGTLGTYNAIGQIHATRTGNRIVAAIYDLQKYELFDFDKSNGTLSNLISIGTYPNAWGCEFSPSETKLYTTQWGGSDAGVLRQFDLSSNDETLINASVSVIGTVTSPNGGYKAGYLQLAPDNKIYVARFTAGYLGVINSPNLLGTASSYTDNGFSLNGKICEAGFPTPIPMFYGKQVGVNDLVVDAFDNISVFPMPFHESATIQLPDTYKTSTVIAELYNICGQKVKEIAFSGTSFVLDRGTLAEGVYNLFIRNGNTIPEHKKIIIE